MSNHTVKIIPNMDKETCFIVVSNDKKAVAFNTQLLDATIHTFVLNYEDNAATCELSPTGYCKLETYKSLRDRLKKSYLNETLITDMQDYL